MKRLIVITGLAAAVLLNAAALRAQQPLVQAAVLKNNMDIPITYQLRLDSGAWRTFTLQPGQKHVNTLPTGSHDLHIRFDRRLGDNVVTLHEARVVTWGTADANNGWLQCFIRVNDGNDVMLSR